jgi:hypothetical protein
VARVTGDEKPYLGYNPVKERWRAPSSVLGRIEKIPCGFFGISVFPFPFGSLLVTFVFVGFSFSVSFYGKCEHFFEFETFLSLNIL